MSQNESGGSKPLSFGTKLIYGHLDTLLATSRQQNLSLPSTFSTDNSYLSTPIPSGNLSGVPPLNSTVPPGSLTVPHLSIPSLSSPLALIPSSTRMPPHDSHIPDHGFMAVSYANNHTPNYEEQCLTTNGDRPPHLRIQVTAAGYMFRPPRAEDRQIHFTSANVTLTQEINTTHHCVSQRGTVTFIFDPSDPLPDFTLLWRY